MASENEVPVPSSSGADPLANQVAAAAHEAAPGPEHAVQQDLSAPDGSPQMPFEPGHVIHGKYELLKPLGSGGVGYVVAARHIGFDDLVALKFLRPEFATHQEAVSRFTIEARASFRLRSEHVARMLDVDIYAGVPFIVMELLEGTDLRNLLETRRVLDLTPSVDYLLQACEALAAAHAIGVIHRDIKPENLFLLGNGDASDHLKVLDFGISKVAVRGDNMRTNHALTRMAVGTPPYMSPEQVRASSALDARSDIWSVGCVLYELLTGTAPFDRVSLMQACAAVLEDEPPTPRDLNPRIPQALSDVIMRCLRKDPSERFADVADLAEALSHFATERMASYPARCRAHLAGEGQGRRSTPPSFPEDRRSTTTRHTAQLGGQQLPPRSITVRLESHAPLTRRNNTGPTRKPTAPAVALLDSVDSLDGDVGNVGVGTVGIVGTATIDSTAVANAEQATAAVSLVSTSSASSSLSNSSGLTSGQREQPAERQTARDDLEQLFVPRRRGGQVLAWCVPIVVGGLLATYLATAEQHARSGPAPSLRSNPDSATDVAPATADDSLAAPAERPQAERDRDKARRQAQDTLPGTGGAELPLGSTGAAAAATADELAAAGASPRTTSLSDGPNAQSGQNGHSAQAERERGDAAHGSTNAKKSSSSGHGSDSKAKSRASARSSSAVKPVEPASVSRPQADPDVGF